MSDKNEYRTFLDEAEKLLAGATNTAIHDRIELRDAVCRFFSAERAKGTAVEGILQSIEAVLQRAEVRVGSVNGHKELALQLIDWCMQLTEPRHAWDRSGTT